MSVIKSRALVVDKPHSDLVVTGIEVLASGSGEVRVKKAASGTCGTDGHAVEGTHPTRNLPVVLGHEGAGVAGVNALQPGDHVVCTLGVPFGSCFQCVRVGSSLAGPTTEGALS